MKITKERLSNEIVGNKEATEKAVKNFEKNFNAKFIKWEFEEGKTENHTFAYFELLG